MSAVLDARSSRGAVVEWPPVIAGLLVLYVPTGYDLATGIWGHEDFAHGPVVLGVVLWLIWKKREMLLCVPAQTLRAAPESGLARLAFGLMLYALGRSQDITLFEVGSLALGLLYLYLMRRRSWLHNGFVPAGILPIAFAANIARVLVLILVTYHFGDAAGQGFLHGGAGILLLTVALIVIFLLDAVLARVIKPRHPA